MALRTLWAVLGLLLGTAGGVVHEVIDLFPSATSSMAAMLQTHGSWKDGKPANALVLFHLDGCLFCEMTLGTMLYNFGHENIFGATGVQPYQIRVAYEGTPVAGHTYCQHEAACEAQASATLGVNVSALTGFPSSFYFDGLGAFSQVGDTPCGIAVRRDADAKCSSSNLTRCEDGSNDLDNWVCNLHTSGAPPTTCKTPSTAWKRCVEASMLV